LLFDAVDVLLALAETDEELGREGLGVLTPAWSCTLEGDDEELFGPGLISPPNASLEM
jgi:hypothetical protein